MGTTKVTAFTQETGKAIDRRMFGAFAEHLGRCVYGGMYDPAGETADEDGFRRDVLELVKELGVSMVRFPGGNFVSSYRWEDGVGPRDERPKRLELAWHTLETNEFGLNEWARWLQKAGIDGMLVVNLGTRGVDAATALVEYCNHPGGSLWSDLRRSHGVEQPHGFRMWGLGNELDGPWQVGSKGALEYGSLASAAARAMKRVDPGLELAVAGSSNRQMKTFPTWDREVLEATYDDVELLAIHQYFPASSQDWPSFLSSAVDFDGYLDDCIATCDYVRALKRSKKVIKLSVDEWNVIHREQGRPRPAPWSVAPALGEYDYTKADGVVEASLLMSLLRHADRVAVSCQSLMVNVGAPIRTQPGGPAFRSAIFAPLARIAQVGEGVVYPIEIETPSFETDLYGEAPTVDAVCVREADGRHLSLFLLNRSASETVEVDALLQGIPSSGPCEHRSLVGVVGSEPEPYVDRGPENLDAASIQVDQGRLSVSLPPASWHAIRVPF